MPFDLKSLSNEDLLALESNDLSKLSDKALSDLEQYHAEEAQAGSKAQIPTSAFSNIRPDIAGAQFQPPAETWQRGGIAALRYAPAVAAGVATGGAGFIPAALATGLTAGASEFAAQGAEELAGFRQGPTDLREIAASTVAGAAVPVPMRPAATTALMTTGQVLKNFLVNAGLGTAASETAGAIKAGAAAPGKEEKLMRFEAPTSVGETALRLLPTVTSGVGTVVQAKSIRANAAFAKREALQAERSGGSVTLSELLPDFTEIEAKAFQSGNEYARNAVANMDVGLGTVINEAYQNAPRADQIKSQMMAYAAPLEDIRLGAVAARDKAMALEERLKTARFTNAEQQTKYAQESRAAAVDAVKQQALYMDGIDRLFPSGLGDLSSVVPGARIDFIKNASKAAKESISEGMSEIFNRVGIGLNEGIANRNDIKNQLNYRIAAKVDRAEIQASLDKALQQPGMLTKEGDITYAGYRRLRDDIASDLVASGKDAKYANMVAGQAYDAVRTSAEKYLRRQDPTVFRQFREANKISSDIYAARSSQTGVIDDLASGNIAGVVSKIEKEGIGPVTKEITAYAEAIKGFGDENARLAANRFKGDVALAIRDHLVETSMLYGKGLDQASQILDVPSLVKRLDTLGSKGLSPETLGFGTRKDVQALARIADAKSGSMTVEQINNFINDVGEVGRDVAVARANYHDAYVNYLASTKSSQQSEALRVLREQAKKAKMTADVEQRVYDAASRDPLVQILNDKNLNLSPRLGDNSKYVDRVLGSGPDGVRNLVTALETKTASVGDNARKAKLLGDLKASATAAVFMDKFQEALSPGDHRVVLGQITDFFYGNSQKQKRDAFISLVGNDAFNTLKNTYAAPIAKILETKARLGVPVSSIRADVIPLFGAVGTLKGQSTRGVIAGNQAVDSLNYFQKKLYNTAYLLYLDPEFAPAYRKFAGNLDAFVNANPRNSVAYQIALNKDQEANR